MAATSKADAQHNERLAKEYLGWLRDVRKAAGVTVYNYASTLQRFLLHIRDTPLDKVAMVQIEAYVTRPRGGRAHGEPGSPSSQAKDVAILGAFYKYLVNAGHFERNPIALYCAPRVRNMNPRPMPDAVWIALWESDLDSPSRVWLGLGFFCGLRRREICELRPEQVAGGKTLMYFTRKGQGDDIFPVSDVIEALERSLASLGAKYFCSTLDEYARSRAGHSFLLEYGEQIASTDYERVKHSLPEGMTEPNLLNRRLRALCKRLDLAHHTPHQLRHSFVTNLLRAGVPVHIVSKLANHTSVAVTARYTKAGGGELREWMATVNRHS